jgi:adenylate kinase family enzyme
MRLLIIGNSGSGKTTLARALAARLNSPRLELDEIVWEAGSIAEPRPQEAVLADLDAFLRRQPRWILEGCYGELASRAAPRADALVFLDPGLETCLANNRARPWEPEKYDRAEDQAAMLPALLDWVREYYERGDQSSWSAHHAIFESFAGRKLALHSLAGAHQQLLVWLAQDAGA